MNRFNSVEHLKLLSNKITISLSIIMFESCSFLQINTKTNTFHVTVVTNISHFLYWKGQFRRGYSEDPFLSSIIKLIISYCILQHSHAGIFYSKNELFLHNHIISYSFWQLEFNFLKKKSFSKKMTPHN